MAIVFDALHPRTSHTFINWIRPGKPRWIADTGDLEINYSDALVEAKG
jgi:hypothetical protein